MFEKQQAQCSQKPFVSWRVSSHPQSVSGSQTQTKRVRSLPSKLEERMFSAKELSAIFLKVVGPAVSSGKILTKVYLFTYFCGAVGSKLILVEKWKQSRSGWWKLLSGKDLRSIVGWKHMIENKGSKLCLDSVERIVDHWQLVVLRLTKGVIRCSFLCLSF